MRRLTASPGDGRRMVQCWACPSPILSQPHVLTPGHRRCRCATSSARDRAPTASAPLSEQALLLARRRQWSRPAPARVCRGRPRGLRPGRGGRRRGVRRARGRPRPPPPRASAGRCSTPSRQQAPGARVWAHGNLPRPEALAASAGWDGRPRAAQDGAARCRPTTPTRARVALPPGLLRPGRSSPARRAGLAGDQRGSVRPPPRAGPADAGGPARSGWPRPWFDPAGLILVETREAPGRVAAFHWTKVDPEQLPPWTRPHRRRGVRRRGAPGIPGPRAGAPRHRPRAWPTWPRWGCPRWCSTSTATTRAAIRTYTGLGFPQHHGRCDVFAPRSPSPLSG